MSNKRNPPPITRILLGSILAVLAIPASGQTINWANNTGNADALWSTGSNWTGGVAPTSTNVANFGALTVTNAESATVGTGETVDALGIVGLTRNPGQFTGFSYTISGTGTINLGASGISFAQSQGITEGRRFIIAPNLALTSNQIWNLTNSGSQLVVTGVVSGNNAIIFQSADSGNASIQQVLRITNQNTFSGGFTVNATNASGAVNVGSSSTVNSGELASGPLGTGTVTLTRGRLRSDGATDRTLHNNFLVTGGVTLGGGTTQETGNTANTGGLIFSDAGLTAPSTFTLGSATNGNITTLRVGSSVTFNQVIAESGGVGQSVQFASISGAPTVTINRSKTATGNILAGGVNLVLANGEANSGSISAVNGSVTAIGTNKFSSGALLSDNAALIAIDASNYSAIAGGKATVYNNGRVSFATDQTQAMLAALFTSDSQLRLGLGSGSGNATVTQNYAQFALGNGRAGLVSASSGIITYNGTLTAGSDSTYRVGGGLGTLALGTALTGGNSLSVEGGGIVTSTSDHTYTGATTVNGTTLTLSGTAGALSGTTGVTINNSGTLNLTNTTALVNASRLGDTVGITLNNANFTLGGTSTAAASETVGDLTVNSGGRNFITIATTPAAATIKTLQFGTLSRNNNAVAVFRGDSLGGTGTARNEIKFSSGPALIGGGGAAGTTTISVLPWARGGTASGNQATGFVTYETNGIRQLNAATEFVQANNDTTARIDQAITTAGGATNYNVRAIPNTTGGATLVNTASSSVTINSLLVDNTGTTASATYSLNSSTINVTSGAVHIQHTASQNLTLGSGTLAFGTAEGVITNNANSFQLTNIGTQITGTGGLSIYTINGGGIQLSAVTAGTGFSGGLTIGGNGYVGVDQDTRFGNAANGITHAGGELRFFAALTSTRGLTLLGNVGNNTLGLNSNTGTVNWNGNITGAGLLRLVNNASTPGGNGFSLGGTNDYTGGTQIEGINVTGSSNNAFGTGTVTLINANSNVAALSLTGTGLSLGGLRGTDGTVTINPTGGSATLSVGANNENTVFNGVIAQGAGKTGSVTKTGTGTLVLGGNNTYTGTTEVNTGTLHVAGSLSGTTNVAVNAGGTLLMSGSGEGRINDTASVALGGGTVALGSAGSLDEQVGALTLSVSSVIDFGSFVDGHTLRFADSSGATWTTGQTLSIWNWTAGADHLFFGDTFGSGLTTAQLNQISFYSDPGTTFLGTGGYGSLGEISPIPEPTSTGLLGSAGLLGLIGFREFWRRRDRLRSAS